MPACPICNQTYNGLVNTQQMSPTGQVIGRHVLRAYRNDDNGLPLPLGRYTIGAILNHVLPLHEENADRIDMLHKFYRSDQLVKYRKKKIRSDITYNMVINYAYRVVEFYTGYTLSNNIQFLAKNLNRSSEVELFNEYYDLDDGHSKNIELGEWCLICGNGYKRTLKHPEWSLSSQEYNLDISPYQTQVLDPRNAFVVYAIEDGLPLFAGTTSVKDKKDDKGNFYKEYGVEVSTTMHNFKWVFEYGNNKKNKTNNKNKESNFPDLEELEPVIPNETQHGIHGIGVIPITEYMNNHNRIGLVEALLDLFNAVNLLGSNALENIEQIVQAYLIFLNADMPKDENGKSIMPKPTGDAISVKGTPGLPADVKLLSLVLDQSGVKTYMDILLDAMVDIGGVPLISSRSATASGGTTGHAEQTRGGWGHADAKAIKFLKLFRSSESRNARTILSICRHTQGIGIQDLSLRDIDVKPTRSRFENVQSKAQAFVAYHRTEVWHPADIAKELDLFDDIEGNLERGKQYWLEEEANDAQTMYEELTALRSLHGQEEEQEDTTGENLPEEVVTE